MRMSVFSNLTIILLVIVPWCKYCHRKQCLLTSSDISGCFCSLRESACIAYFPANIFTDLYYSSRSRHSVSYSGRNGYLIMKGYAKALFQFCIRPQRNVCFSINVCLGKRGRSSWCNLLCPQQLNIS